MICNYIKLKNYRNIENQEIIFDEGVNVLSGNNAQGKTNLIEAIYTFTTGKSFRAVKETDSIKFGEKEYLIEIGFKDSSRSDIQTLSISMARGCRRKILLNGVKIDKLSEMIGYFKSVLFCPEHLSLIKEGPSMRRNYLDVAISQFRPVYLKSLQKYYAILEQRNKLIKNAEADFSTLKETINIWSEQLAHEAAFISHIRSRYVKKVEEAVAEYFCTMTDEKEKVEMSYIGSSKQSPDEYEDIEAVEKRYKELLSSNIEREIAAGSTLWGIHKDDIEILINGKSARSFASQGQQRSLALAMKLAEGDICRYETGEDPIFLLDDVLSELDEKRRNFLLCSIKDRQVIISTCENTDFAMAKKILVKNGEYIF